MDGEEEQQSPHGESEEQRKLRARFHRILGSLATVLVVVAVIVALSRMRHMFGISPLAALGIGASTLPWILLILGIGALFSLGTAKLAYGVERLVNLIRRRRNR